MANYLFIDDWYSNLCKEHVYSAYRTDKYAIVEEIVKSYFKSYFLLRIPELKLYLDPLNVYWLIEVDRFIKDSEIHELTGESLREYQGHKFEILLDFESEKPMFGFSRGYHSCCPMIKFLDYTFEYKTRKASLEEIQKYQFKQYGKKPHFIEITIKQNDEIIHTVKCISSEYWQCNVLEVDGETLLRSKESNSVSVNKFLSKFSINPPRAEKLVIDVPRKEKVPYGVITMYQYRKDNPIPQNIEINIPIEVKIIKASAFHCYDPTVKINVTINYEGTKEEWFNIKKGEITYIEEEDWVDYQHFKSITNRRTEYDGFIVYRNDAVVTIVTKDETFIYNEKEEEKNFIRLNEEK